MAYQLLVKYFNSFWLKKVTGDSTRLIQEAWETDYPDEPFAFNSTVTTGTLAGNNGEYSQDGLLSARYIIPTWPGIPWGWTLGKPNITNPNIENVYPCFPWGGRDWNAGTVGTIPPCEGGSLINTVLGREEGDVDNWAIEEARIRGGYNNTTLDFGVKAYLVEDDNDQEHRFSDLIYSGVFNSATGVNNTNVFSTATNITKSVDPANGSIQRLYAYDTNLTIFQENKVSKALIDKDAIYSAEGAGTPVSSTQLVIGQVVPYVGEFGISKNPESWAQYGFRQYFADRFRGSIMRLSRDGLTEISAYGLTDYFRDELSTVKDISTAKVLTFPFISQKPPSTFIVSFQVENIEGCDCEQIPIGSLIRVNGNSLNDLYVADVTYAANTDRCTISLSRQWRPIDFGLNNWPIEISFQWYVKDRIQGGFDTHNKNYVVSIQKESIVDPCYEEPLKRDIIWTSNQYNDTYDTLNFDESINGWVSFYSYRPTLMDSLKNNYYSVKDGKLYKHYADIPNNFGVFYGEQFRSTIEFIFNPKPSIQKNFQTVNYEGSNGWGVDWFVSDPTEQIVNPFAGNFWPHEDMTNPVLSLEEGKYINPLTQYTDHAGFYRKENRYVSNLINSSSQIPGQVIEGKGMSGIKGFYATVRLATDQETDVGGLKELYAVSSKWVVSSQ